MNAICSRCPSVNPFPRNQGWEFLLSKRRLTDRNKAGQMASSVDELTINYTEDGVAVVKELDKVVLSKGAWSTVMFRYQEWNRSKAEYGPEKYSIRRYQKRNGEYVAKSKFNISSVAQAKALIEALQGWIGE